MTSLGAMTNKRDALQLWKVADHCSDSVTQGLIACGGSGLGVFWLRKRSKCFSEKLMVQVLHKQGMVQTRKWSAVFITSLINHLFMLRKSTVPLLSNTSQKNELAFNAIVAFCIFFHSWLHFHQWSCICASVFQHACAQVKAYIFFSFHHYRSLQQQSQNSLQVCLYMFSSNKVSILGWKTKIFIFIQMKIRPQDRLVKIFLLPNQSHI